MMRTYRASGKAPVTGFILLLLLTVIAGVGVGLLLFAIDWYLQFYLVLVFPLIAGILVGGILGLGVKVGRVRSAVIAGLFGLIAGLLTIGTYHFATYYIGFRGEARTALAEEGETPSEADVDAFTDLVLEDEVGEGGFMGYMRLAAREGITITRTASSSTSGGTTFAGDATWIYWGVELLIVVIAAIVAAAGPARQPFDEEAGRWYEKAEWIANGYWQSQKELKQALTAGDYRKVGSLLTPHDLRYPRMELHIRRSPDDGAPDVMVLLQSMQQRNRSSTLVSGLVSLRELEQIKSAMSAAPPIVEGKR